MSTFPGIVEEIPGISVDRFDNDNNSSSAFFLSHCHTDHMTGLDLSFFHALTENDKYLYCTSLSKLFLKSRCNLGSSESERIRILSPCSPVIVEYTYNGERQRVTVVSVNAGHCPGSVMFLFEQGAISVLYTGDFRINPKDFCKLLPLHDRTGETKVPKRFNTVYLDTTFLSPEYKDFPSRSESLTEISKAARDWIARDRRNVVVLECSAFYGSEFLFLDLRESLKMRIHVKSQVYDDFARIPELERCVTNDGCSTKLHACMSKNSRRGLTCNEVEADRILTIVPSAYRWRGKDTSLTISEKDPWNPLRLYVCQSMHSSYNELRAFVQYFKANKYVACVQPPNCVDSIQTQLEEMTKDSPECKEFSQSNTYELDLASVRSSKRRRAKSQYFSDDSSD